MFEFSEEMTEADTNQPPAFPDAGPDHCYRQMELPGNFFVGVSFEVFKEGGTELFIRSAQSVVGDG